MSKSLITHPKAAKAGVKIKELVIPNNKPAAVGIVIELYAKEIARFTIVAKRERIYSLVEYPSNSNGQVE